MSTEEVEEWREIPGYDGMYEVSDWGRVRSWVNNRWGGRRAIPRVSTLTVSATGYLVVSLAGIKPYQVSNTFLVHQLVSDTWIGLREKGQVVHHRDCNRSHNHVLNLEVLSYREHGCVHRGQCALPENVIFIKRNKNFPYLVRLRYQGQSRAIASFSTVEEAADVAQRVRDDMQKGTFDRRKYAKYKKRANSKGGQHGAGKPLGI